MGHGHEHGDPYKVPDFRIYKVEDAPLLMKTQKALHSQGLHDPWLRNEVWRYAEKEFSTPKKRFNLVFFRGFKLGLAAAVLTVVGTKLYDSAFPQEHEHHEH